MAAADPVDACSTPGPEADPERPYLIEGLREGGRQFTFRDLRAPRRSHGRRRSARSACGPGDVVSWQLPNWFEGAALAVAIDRLGAVSNPIITIYREREVAFVCRQARLARAGRPGDGARRRPSRAGARGAGAARRDSSTSSPCAPSPAAGQRALESLEDDPERAAAAVAARPARRRGALLHLRDDRRSEGRAAHAVDARRRPALPRAALPAVARRPQPAAVPAHAHRRRGDVRPACRCAAGIEHRCCMETFDPDAGDRPDRAPRASPAPAARRRSCRACSRRRTSRREKVRTRAQSAAPARPTSRPS